MLYNFLLYMVNFRQLEPQERSLDRMARLSSVSQETTGWGRRSQCSNFGGEPLQYFTTVSHYATTSICTVVVWEVAVHREIKIIYRIVLSTTECILYCWTNCSV